MIAACVSDEGIFCCHEMQNTSRVPQKPDVSFYSEPVLSLQLLIILHTVILTYNQEACPFTKIGSLVQYTFGS